MPLALTATSDYMIERVIDGSASAPLILALRQCLLDMGFAESANTKSYVRGTFTGIAAAGQTVTIDGEVFTWRATPTLPFEVAIGATAAAACGNLVIAYNSYATKGHIASAETATAIRITAGSAVNFTVSETSNNFVWDWSFADNARYLFRSRPTPQGIAVQLQILQKNGTVRLYVTDPSESVAADADDGIYLQPAVGRQFTVIGCEYQFIWFVAGLVDNGPGLSGIVTIPRVLEGMEAASIIELSEYVEETSPGPPPVYASRIKITTSTPHGLLNNELVWLSNIYVGDGVTPPTLITALEGSWQVTKIDATSYWLQGSTWSVSYAHPAGGATSGLSANQNRAISMCAFAFGLNNGTPYTAIRTIRTSPYLLRTAGVTNCKVIVNNLRWNSYSGNVIPGAVVGTFVTHLDAFVWQTATPSVAVRTLTFGSIGDEIEPRLAVTTNPVSGNLEEVGNLWNCFFATALAPIDQRVENLGGHDWVNILDPTGQYGSWWFATHRYPV